MELKRAKEVLEDIKKHSLAELQAEKKNSRTVRFYISIPGYSFRHELFGNYTPEQQEAIATWMRDPEGVVGA